MAAAGTTLRVHLIRFTGHCQGTTPMMVQQVLAIDRTPNMGANYTAIFLSIVPVILVYLFLSRFIIGGVAAGGVKE